MYVFKNIQGKAFLRRESHKFAPFKTDEFAPFKTDEKH